jgi:two-component system phosphate regulon sensor histidine kinase PhoR
MRLRSRFSALFGVLAAAAALLLMLVFDDTLRRAVEDRVVDRIERERDHLAGDVGQFAGRPEELDAFLRRAARDLECRITLVAADGRVSTETDMRPADVASLENHGNRPEVREARERGDGAARRFSGTEREDRLYFARRLPDGSVLRLSVARAQVRQLERPYVWSARLAIAAACLGLFFIGSTISRRFSEPIAALTRAASAIAAGDRGRDLPEAGAEEVQLLGASLTRMKDTLEKSAERADAERRLTAMVFERLPDGLVVVDSRLHVLESNARFSRMIGVTAPAGRALYDLLRHRALYELFESTLRNRETVETTVRLADDLVWHVTVLALPEGSRAAAVGVLRDVTRLERTESMRRTFVADVSHELRTPIASIAAAAETLAEGGTDDADTAELLGLIRRQSDRMRELIDDLMDLAQIESGSVELRREPLSLPALTSEIAQDFAAASAARSIRISVESPAGVLVEADRRRLGQVIRNLLDNAIKFSREGGTVRLTCGRDAEGAFFSITDEGPGIPRAEQERIFQRFYQIDRSRSKARPGTGLGLAIVKHLVQLHGGRVEVESEVGRGSTFRVRLPEAETVPLSATGDVKIARSET